MNLRRFDGTSPRFQTTVLHSIERWRPDAIAANVGDVAPLSLLRRRFRSLPIVSHCNMPETVANSVVGGSTQEILHIACDFFRAQGLGTLACFCASEPIAGAHLTSFFRKEVTAAPVLTHEITTANLRAEPRGAAKRVIGNWLTVLPKPAGVLVIDTHGGPYLARLCQQMGLRVPQDIQIICADEADECIECSPRLTSIQMPWRRIGETMTETLLQYLRTPSQPPPRLNRVLGSVLIPRGSTTQPPPTDIGVSKALSIIQTNTTGGYTVKDVHRLSTRNSRSTFYRQFRGVTGKTPASLLRATRLKEACRLLKETTASITRIAESCGFSSPNYFAQVFTRELKMSPRAYRKNSIIKK